ncbi:RNA recognition motif. (a.k.a. RRM, RBD, or RNP domain) [Oceanospirillum multiglobuliferum]|uniref:RRM domain-containing protein n=1 Tax=Oceanospirillum multiglobuliferum TaxID=64969 RepID=A0A1T4KHG0_9GAMM|nr:hypothetical protein [Oceanospirillum multiglobuliferum]OPX56036.1 hypothetical protein BTE48_05610 [Oceanospirillum multiglobuliferum]SJZ41815.1 RNA recognition motif. (a.k.a. RRM, RBD, or RNP domain) [Oceanospirillum multiglobuliferum]
MQNNKLFIGNLSFTVTEADLESSFASYGELEEVKVVQDRETGRSRGFGFVTFTTDAAASAALAQDGKDLNGRDLRVSIAESKPRPRTGSRSFNNKAR